MDKFEFASPAWLAALKELLVTYTKKAGDGLELSICEIFTGVPKHLDKHGNGVIAWHCLIKDGKVHFEETAIPEADVHSQADYAFIVPVARKVYSPEVMPEVEAYMAKGTAEGKMISKSKNRGKVPPIFTLPSAVTEPWPSITSIAFFLNRPATPPVSVLPANHSSRRSATPSSWRRFIFR